MKTIGNVNRRERIYSLLIVLILLTSVVMTVHFFNERPTPQEAAQWSPYIAARQDNVVAAADTVATISVDAVEVPALPGGLDYVNLRLMIDAVEFTETGAVTLSEQTRSQLEQAVVAFGMDRTAQEINAVHLAIADYLPTEKARALSDFFGSYYAYKQAERDFLQGKDGDSLADSIAQYEVIQQLRHNYLGAEQSDQLFQAEHNFMQATLSAMREQGQY